MDRRDFIRGGLSAFALGALGSKGLIANQRPPRPCAASGALQINATTPFLEIPSSPPSVMVDGIPFAKWFFGDDFDNNTIPFHFIPDYFNGGLPPEPAEEVDVAVVGGGLSGLASAYFLRHHNTVLFELRDRFGGNSMGEVWHDIKYSLGGAYFITPDPGSFLQHFYHELGLHRLIRTNDPPDPMELNGVIRDDFWSGVGASPEEQRAFRRYAEVVTDVWENQYPDIPLSKDPVEAARVRALDLINFSPGRRATHGYANDSVACGRCSILLFFLVRCAHGRNLRCLRVELCRGGRRRTVGPAGRKFTIRLRTLAAIEGA